MDNTACAKVLISGRVQGVFFRMETKQAAERFDITGWVKNRNDGTVEALFEGQKENIDQILKWCEKGPPLSKVNHVGLTHQKYSGQFKTFKITY